MTRIVKFSECVEYMIKGPFGSDMKKSLYVPKGDNTYKVYIQGNAIQQDEALGDYYVSEEYFHDKLERFEVHPGDYIITCDGTLGKFIKLSDGIERGVISSSLLLLKLNEEIINDKYFELLWEHTMLATLASQARNACLVHLPSAKAIGDLNVKLPEMSEQLAIAEKAFSVKRNIAYREKQQELLDELIKARFVELSSEWNIKETPLCDYLDEITYGFTNPMPDSESGPWKLTAKDIVDGHINFATARKTTQESFDALTAKSKPVIGDVLLTKDGSLGRTAVVEDERICVNQSVAVLRCNDHVIPRFLSLLLQLPEYQREMTKNSGGGTIKHIYITKVDKMLVKIPTIHEQERFIRFVEQVDKSKVVVQKSLEEAQLLFDSLMQEYFG